MEEVNINGNNNINVCRIILGVLLAFALSIGVGGLIGMLTEKNDKSDNNEIYLNSKMASCPSITLKEGLKNLESPYYDFNYKIEKGANVHGEEKTYLHFSYFNIYTSIEIKNNQVVFGDYSFSTIDNTAEGSSTIIIRLMCGD